MDVRSVAELMSVRELHWRVGDNDVACRIDEAKGQGTFSVFNTSLPFRILDSSHVEIAGKIHRFYVAHNRRHGYCPRSEQPEEQTREILRRFGLQETPGSIAPFVRCLECNGLLEAVTKEQVADRLSGEPLTLRFHDQFSTCPNCGRIYWEGSHFDKLTKRISKILMP